MENVFGYITIAASNSTNEAKRNADFVCTGKNDELVIQQGIDECQKQNKNLYFMNGIYNINGFYDSLIALINDLANSKAVIPEINTYFDVVESVDDEILLNYLKEIKK